MPRTPRVAIVGGGIGGLATALALERRGAETIVCEQSGALSEIGAGLNLTPNTVKALRSLGLNDAVEGIGYETDFLNIRNWKSGRFTSRQRRGCPAMSWKSWVTRVPSLSIVMRDCPNQLAMLMKLDVEVRLAM